jgi:uncharacterized coiled-coil protein SlyX
VLSDANKTLAEANKTLAEANLVISKNHDELIQLTKMIVANSGQLTKVPVVHQSKGTSKEIRFVTSEKIKLETDKAWKDLF